MNQARPSLIRTTCALLFVLMHGIAFAEDEAGTAAPPEPPPIPDTLKSPRATMETFLAAMKATRPISPIIGRAISPVAAAFRKDRT